MIKPISPDEVVKTVPDEVIGVFNELISMSWNGKKSIVYQCNALRAISEKLGISQLAVLDRFYLDIEPLYREIGWKVRYNKAGYNEQWFEPYFEFTKK